LIIEGGGTPISGATIYSLHTSGDCRL